MTFKQVPDGTPINSVAIDTTGASYIVDASGARRTVDHPATPAMVEAGLRACVSDSACAIGMGELAAIYRAMRAVEERERIEAVWTWSDKPTLDSPDEMPDGSA